MKKLLIFFALVLAACSASEKETPAESTDTPEDTAQAHRPASSDSVGMPEEENETAAVQQVFLDCRMVLEKRTTTDTFFIVSLIVRDERIPFDTVAFCAPISPSDYAAYDIPSGAIDACGGWHEEAGEYFYLVEDGLDLVVNHAWLKEEQTTNSYPYKEAYRLQLPEVDF